MKIGLITTFFGGKAEDTAVRIQKEAELLGHDLSFIDMSDFNLDVKNSKLNIPKIDDHYDLIIVRGVFKSIKPIASIVQYIKNKGIPVFDNSFVAHKYVIDKITDLIKLSANGIVTPDTIYERKFDTYLERAGELGYPFIFKNTRKGQGAGVSKIDSESEFEKHITELRDNGESERSFLMQEFIEYEHDLRVLVIGDRQLVMKRIPPENDFRANFSIGGSVEPFDLDEEGRELAWKATQAVDMTVAGVDILIDKKGKKYILEVNHTPGMTGMELALSQNIAIHYVKHAIASAN